MPPFEITDPDDIAQVTIVNDVNLSAYISEMSFSHYIRGCTGLSVSDIKTAIETPLAALLGAAATDGIRNVLSTSCSIVRTEISKPLVEPPPVRNLTTRALVGQESGVQPPDIAMCVSFGTDTSGPAFRGRNYIGGLGTFTLDTSLGIFASAKCTGLAADWSTYLTQLQALTGDFEQITLSRFHNVGGVTVARSTPLGATVTTVTIDTHVDTQRRRGVR